MDSAILFSYSLAIVVNMKLLSDRNADRGSEDNSIILPNVQGCACCSHSAIVYCPFSFHLFKQGQCAKKKTLKMLCTRFSL